MTGTNTPGEEPTSPHLSTRGFSRSGGAARIKACPTALPDKPDQKEWAERGSGAASSEGFFFLFLVRVKQLLTPSDATTDRCRRRRGRGSGAVWSVAATAAFVSLKTPPPPPNSPNHPPVWPYLHPRSTRHHHQQTNPS